jgi:hypothetical protein
MLVLAKENSETPIFFQMCYHVNLYYEYILLVEEIGIIGDIDVFPIKK